MTDKKDEALKLAQDLRALADRFSEGWHDGIKIDASDIVLLSDAAEALADHIGDANKMVEQPAQQEPVDVVWFEDNNGASRKSPKDCQSFGANGVPAAVWVNGVRYTSPQPARQEPVPDWDAWNVCSRLNSALEAIGNFAHDKSTGPAEPDALWEIRAMAYAAIEALAEQPPQQQEPDIYPDEAYEMGLERIAYYASPQPSKPWVGLTPEDKLEIEKIVGITEDDDGWMVSQMFTLTEAKLKEKNS